jgi:hypothetical protein
LLNHLVCFPENDNLSLFSFVYGHLISLFGPRLKTGFVQSLKRAITKD